MSQSVVSRPFEEHREMAVLEKELSTMIFERRKLLLKHYGTWCII